MNRKVVKILLILALIIIPVTTLSAAETKSGDSIYVAKDEIVSGNLYAAGQSITIDGAVSGDIIAAAQTIKVNGRVEGDIIAAAQDIVINGEVGGNIRIIGNSIAINGDVARNANAFGSSITIGSNSKIGWDVFMAGLTTEVRGVIDGDLSAYVDKILIGGKIGKNVNLKFGQNKKTQEIIIAPEAVVNGNFSYSSNSIAKISEKASIAGQVQQIPQEDKNSPWLWLWSKTFAIFAALSVGLMLIFLTRNVTNRILSALEEHPLKAFAPGLVLTFVIPPIAAVLAITVIGLPLGLIVLAWWLVGIYLAKIFTALVIGRLLVKKIIKREWSLFVSLVLGIFICWLLFSIPVVGWIISLIATFFGLGGIWYYVLHQLKHI